MGHYGLLWSAMEQLWGSVGHCVVLCGAMGCSVTPHPTPPQVHGVGLRLRLSLQLLLPVGAPPTPDLLLLLCCPTPPPRLDPPVIQVAPCDPPHPPKNNLPPLPP